MPHFSVLIPSYNRPEYVSQAVASVFANAETDFELIVSDNCSPRQAEIVQALAPFVNDSRFTLVTQSANLGEARNRHFLMERARGTYRIIIGDDDLLAPQALSVLRDAIARDPGFDFYLVGYAVVDEEGRVFETRRALAPLVLDLNNLPIVKDVFCSDLFPYWFYHPATFCFSASLHRDIVPNHSVGIGDDLIFVFDAIAARKRALIVPAVLFSYRRFMSDYTQTNLSKTMLGNVLTRRHILYNLLARENLAPELKEFVRSREFRRRFLYNSVVIDPDISEAAFNRLDLAPEHLAELCAYWRPRHNRWFRHWLQLRRVVDFVGYFGFSGLRESVRIFRQRRSFGRL